VNLALNESGIAFLQLSLGNVAADLSIVNSARKWTGADLTAKLSHSGTIFDPLVNGLPKTAVK
jgi:hypothetical protein